jgi:hypothetical protein
MADAHQGRLSLTVAAAHKQLPHVLLKCMPCIPLYLPQLLQTRHTAGSLLGLCWSPDATRIAAAGGTGSLLIAAVLEVSKHTATAVCFERPGHHAM